ncbi:MAG: CapA family protein [Fimbriimonadaceae bacterium]|nr:CapA family protein [Fimbriimonadaceae bacterium]
MAESPRARIVAVGDLMFGRGVTGAFDDGRRSAESALAPETLELLQGDLVTGNLECLLTEATERSPYSHSHFKARASFAEPVLRRFHCLNLANNHTYDFLDRGIADTIAALEAWGIPHVGVGPSEEEALRPAEFEVHGLPITVFGLTSVGTIDEGRSKYRCARPNDRALALVREVRAKGSVVIVHFHGGEGDFDHPGPESRKTVQRLTEAGAHVVLGHHPHVVQGWTETNGSLAFYSFGDFVFDKREDGRDRALLAEITIDQTGVPSVTVHHVGRGDDLVVRPLAGSEQAAERARVHELCEAIAAGRSDALYSSALGANLSGSVIASLKKDFRAGGLKAVWRTARRLNPAKIARILKALLARGRPRG